MAETIWPFSTENKHLVTNLSENNQIFNGLK